MITNYALIDHVGSVEDAKKIYNKTYKIAAHDGFVNSKESKTVWTMKQVCATMSPYASEITDKMKYRARYTKHPQMVYLVCDTIESSKVEFIKSIWEERNIPVTIISEQDGCIEPEAPKTFYYGLEISIYRRCALIWANALGWTFSAPLIRNSNIITADPWQKRPDAKEMRELIGDHISKISTNPEKFQDAFLTVASEDECKAFFQHYRWLYENNLLAESLEPDWTLCPTCGRPIRLGTAESIKCDYCDTEVHSEVFETFYDDSYEDSDEWN